MAGYAIPYKNQRLNLTERKCSNLSERYSTREHYPFNLPVLQQTKRIEFPTAVTFLVGENGSGKSTCLEALARKCRIHIWRDVRGTRFEINPWEGRLFQFLDAEWTNGSVPGSYFDSEVSQQDVMERDWGVLIIFTVSFAFAFNKTHHKRV